MIDHLAGITHFVPIILWLTAMIKMYLAYRGRHLNYTPTILATGSLIMLACTLGVLRDFDIIHTPMSYSTLAVNVALSGVATTGIYMIHSYEQRTKGK